MQVGVLEREKREVSPDVVRVWVRPDCVFEPASSDLVIIGRITPTTKAGTRTIEYVGVVQVRRIWTKIIAMSSVMVPRSPNMQLR